MSVHFSIVIPVFNASGSLEESLQSVASQSYPGWEVIIVDDGSTDESPAIIEKWKDEHPGVAVRVITQENRGLGAARNRGIAAARHPWVAFLDADDLWEPERLQKLSAHIARSRAEVYYHPVKTFGLGGKKLRKGYPVSSLRDLLTRGNPLLPSATVVSRETLKDFPFSENHQHHGAEDFHLWLRLLKAGKKFQYLKKPLTRYRETGGMSTDVDTHLSHVFRVLEDLHEQGLFGPHELAVAKKRKHLEAARFYQKRGEFVLARKHYALTELKNPKHKLLYWLNFLKLAI